jgi:hypothetical protein
MIWVIPSFLSSAGVYLISKVEIKGVRLEVGGLREKRSSGFAVQVQFCFSGLEISKSFKVYPFIFCL